MFKTTLNPMAINTGNTNDEILVLPWNRWPNYLISLVALVNLVGGIVALCVASGFAKPLASFNDWVAVVFIGLFGFLFIWVAWCFRTGVLPVRFVADAVRRECGFRWGAWWNGRFDLAGAVELIGELRSYCDHWHWAILRPADSPEQEDQWLYGSGKSFDSAEAAREDCRRVISRLGEHLSLPFEIRCATSESAS
jgi:hypothetical protein